MIEILTAGLLMGLASGIHCVGMCGPLVASFPPSGVGQSIYLDPYHLARIFTYGVLGILTGVLGTLFSFAGLHIFAGIVFCLLLVIGILFFKKGKLQTGLMSRSFFVPLWNEAFRSGGLKGRFALGALNGMLPCGMVYFALATSLAWGGVTESVGFMLSFGLGTLPLLLLIPIIGRALPVGLKSKLKPFQPILFVASLLIVLWRVVLEPMGWMNWVPFIENTPLCS